MKILFICGGLEPGRDGVGDYTRKLSAELIRQGHLVSVIAINDQSIKEPVSGMQLQESTNISVWRLPSLTKEKKCFDYAKQLITAIKPDFLSLQFVPFSFHPKGLSLGLSNFLKNLGEGINWHIMFHELWVGMSVKDAFKLKLWGKAQKFLIESMIAKLRPAIIHTQCDAYVEQLKRSKHMVKKLPLFSNIDVCDVTTDVNENLIHFLNNEPIIRFVFFGGLHPEGRLKGFVQKLTNLEGIDTSSFEFLYIGRNGHEINNHLPVLEQYNISYKVFGELNPHSLSYLLSASSVGVATGSLQFLEKNGTVSAMIAHRLPVICIGKDYIPDKQTRTQLLKDFYTLNNFEQIFSHPPVIKPYIKIADVANQFIKDIQVGL